MISVENHRTGLTKKRKESIMLKNEKGDFTMKLYETPRMEMIVFSTENVLQDASNVITTPVVPFSLHREEKEEAEKEFLHPTR